MNHSPSSEYYHPFFPKLISVASSVPIPESILASCGKLVQTRNWRFENGFVLRQRKNLPKNCLTSGGVDQHALSLYITVIQKQ
jgi:hypothetical protein